MSRSEVQVVNHIELVDCYFGVSYSESGDKYLVIAYDEYKDITREDSGAFVTSKKWAGTRRHILQEEDVTRLLDVINNCYNKGV